MPIVKKEPFWIIQPDLTEKRQDLPINFSAKNGLFSIKLPDFMASVLEGRNEAHSRSMGADGEVVEEHKYIVDQFISSDTLEGVIRAFKKEVDKLSKILNTKNRKKVIIVNFRAQIYLTYGDAEKAQIRYGEMIDGQGGKINLDKEGEWKKYVVLRREDLSFAKTPALELNYFVCYQVGQELYELDDMDHIGSVDSWKHDQNDNAIYLEWTEEREKFFEEARLGLLKTIFSIDKFVKGVRKDPALLDAWISRQPLLSAGKETK